jgi:nucleotide-binding universal stress UspA family protein
MKTILVPLDLSRAAVRVCNAACNLARLTQGRLILLHVVTPPPLVLSDAYAFDAGQLAKMSAETEKATVRRLQALARHCAKRKVRATTVHLSGPPAGTILARAASSRAAYIVMGSHGHGAMHDLLVGSTTHGVMKKARCPVLVVPGTGR